MTAESAQDTIAVITAAESAADHAYVLPELGAEFRQGEIISNLSQFFFDQPSESVSERSHPFIVIASQDCDLLQDFNARMGGKASDLNGVLCYEAHPTTSVRQAVPPGRDIWKRIVQNNDDRYHALQAVPEKYDVENEGLPDVIVDFKRFFSITPDDLKYQINAGTAKRRTVLCPPYREHFQARAAFYLQRVGVPLPFEIAIVSKS